MKPHNPPASFRSLGRVLLAIGITLAWSTSIAAQDVDVLQARVAELEARLADREARIAELEAELATLRQRQTQVTQREAQLDQRERNLETMAGAVTTGALAEQFLSQVKVEYDDRRDRTVVSAGPVWFENETLVGDFAASAVYSVPGDTAAGTPESVSLFIQGEFSGRQFESLQTMTFEVAGEELVLPVADYRQTRKRSGLSGKNRANKGDETLTFVVDVPTLRRLAEATSLVTQTHEGPLTWSRQQRALLRALLVRMDAADQTASE